VSKNLKYGKNPKSENRAAHQSWSLFRFHRVEIESEFAFAGVEGHAAMMPVVCGFVSQSAGVLNLVSAVRLPWALNLLFTVHALKSVVAPTREREVFVIYFPQQSSVRVAIGALHTRGGRSPFSNLKSGFYSPSTFQARAYVCIFRLSPEHDLRGKSTLAKCIAERLG
jgi:hypothetical protein